MPTNKYVPEELDERHNALEEQVSEAMRAAAFATIRAHELEYDEHVIAEYAEVGEILAEAYSRLFELANHL